MSSLPHISLSAEEAELCELLTSCAKWIDDTNALAPLEDLPDTAASFIEWKAAQDRLGTGREKVQLRVAGGWVRDKVSQVDSLARRALLPTVQPHCENDT